MPDVQIGRALGVGATAVAEWKKDPIFVAEVERVQKAMAEAVFKRALASKAGLIQAQIWRLQRHYALMEKRAAEHAAIEEAVGGDTGLLAKQVKVSPTGQHVTEYVYDAQLQRTISDLEERIAKLGGQWVERTAHMEVTITDQLTDEQRLAVRRALTGRED